MSLFKVLESLHFFNFIIAGYESSESDSSDEEIGGNITSIPECLLRCKEDEEDEESSKEDPSQFQNSRILEHYKQQVCRIYLQFMSCSQF